MQASKLFWYGNMGGAIAGWIFIFSGLLTPFQGGIKMAWLTVSIIWCVAHPLELITSLPIGEKAGFSTKQTIINTLVFGITWWIPVKIGVFKA